MKHLNLLVVGLIVCFSSFGQTSYLTENNNILELSTRGMAAKKKEIPAAAIKQALNDLLLNGVMGYNNDQPLISSDKASENQRFIDNMINNRSLLYVKSSDGIGSVEKISGMYRGEVRVSLYLGMIKKELRARGIEMPGDEKKIKEEVVAKLMPTISIVPFKKEGENYKELWERPEVRASITAVTKAFLDKKIETRNVLASSNAAGILSAYEMGSATSIDRELLMSSGTDVYVTVAYNAIREYGKTKVSLTLNAYETSTGIDIGAIQGFSPSFDTYQVDRLCARIAETKVPELLDQVIPKWNNLANEGRSIMVSFSLDQLSTMNFDSEVGADFFPLRDAIRMWFKENAKDGSFKLKGNNDTSIIYDKVMIPAIDESGNPYSIDDFGFELYRFLRKDLGLACTRKIDSQTLMIVIK